MVPEDRMAVALDIASSTQKLSRAIPLRPVDLLLLGYVGVVSVVAAIRAPSQPGCWWLLLAHALFLVLLGLITRPGLGPVGRTVRELYPLLLLPALYSELDILNSASLPVHDATVRHWEMLLFGSQVSREWWQAVPSSFWSSLLHAAYLSYYLIVAAPALYFAGKGDLAAVRRFVLVVMATFITCYLFFIFFPVAGPYYEFPRPAAWFTANIPAHLAYQALTTGSSYGAAFPSSHVAAALAATLAALRGSRRLGLVLLFPTALLTVGVVYCQMHYAVDALAGLAVGGLVTWVIGRRQGVSGKAKVGPKRRPEQRTTERAWKRVPH
jgi:membrane-associated phospholipid phosphatase